VLLVTSPACTHELRYQARGAVCARSEQDDARQPTTFDWEGVSVRIRLLATGLVEEAFVDTHGAFSQEVELEVDQDNTLEWSVWDANGRESVRMISVVRHLSAASSFETGAPANEVSDAPQRTVQVGRVILDPAWPHFAQLVRQCLDLAAELANRSGRDREELFKHVHTQDRYAEQAFEEQNQKLYRECWDNLTQYANYLTRLLKESIPRPLALHARTPEAEARDEVERFRKLLASVWKELRRAGRVDLEPRMVELARSASGLCARLRTDPVAALRDARRLGGEVEKIRREMHQRGPESEPDGGGLLEGST